MTQDKTLLSANAISFVYPSGVKALNALSFGIAKGEFIALVGPSGCGKSTLLRVLAGLLIPTHGSVLLNNEPITRPSTQIGLMFQDAALLPWRDVRSNVALPLELGAQTFPSHHRHVELMLQLVGLQEFEKAYPAQLSGGMAQRVALARALVSQPPLLLLDEPFGALDAFTRERLVSALEAIWLKANTTALLVTHNIAEAVFLADRILVSTPRPGAIVGEITVNLPRPRSWEIEKSSHFQQAVAQVRSLMGASFTEPARDMP
jgi:NitT/TauT family transport system ATP-binding protein